HAVTAAFSAPHGHDIGCVALCPTCDGRSFLHHLDEASLTQALPGTPSTAPSRGNAWPRWTRTGASRSFRRAERKRRLPSENVTLAQYGRGPRRETGALCFVAAFRLAECDRFARGQVETLLRAIQPTERK